MGTEKAAVNSSPYNHFDLMLLSFVKLPIVETQGKWISSIPLRCRILLASGFHTRQYSDSHQDNAADNDPVHWHMHESRTINQPDHHNDEAGNVDGE